jgi:hypothetical protein
MIGGVRSSTVRIALVAGIGVAILVLGIAIGAGVAGIGQGEPSARASLDESFPAATRSPVIPPGSDVAGEDLARLPRYPGAVRTEFSVDEDAGWRTTSVEYLADASMDEVRHFYQGVVVDQGWQRADVAFSGGEWTYVLVDGRSEAVIELEEVSGLVEIDLQIGEPVSDAPPGDDDDDDDDGADDDDG